MWSRVWFHRGGKESCWGLRGALACLLSGDDLDRLNDNPLWYVRDMQCHPWSHTLAPRSVPPFRSRGIAPPGQVVVPTRLGATLSPCLAFLFRSPIRFSPPTPTLFPQNQREVGHQDGPNGCAPDGDSPTGVDGRVAHARWLTAGSLRQLLTPPLLSGEGGGGLKVRAGRWRGRAR